MYILYNGRREGSASADEPLRDAEHGQAVYMREVRLRNQEVLAATYGRYEYPQYGRPPTDNNRMSYSTTDPWGTAYHGKAQYKAEASPAADDFM
jgi:hypothetical protein